MSPFDIALCLLLFQLLLYPVWENRPKFLAPSLLLHLYSCLVVVYVIWLGWTAHFLTCSRQNSTEPGRHSTGKQEYSAVWPACWLSHQQNEHCTQHFNTYKNCGNCESSAGLWTPKQKRRIVNNWISISLPPPPTLVCNKAHTGHSKTGLTFQNQFASHTLKCNVILRRTRDYD